MANDDQELLTILQAQGQQFLASFSLPEFSQKKRKRTDNGGKGKNKVSKVVEDESVEEWLGFGSEPSPFDDKNSSEGSSDEDFDEGLKRDQFILVQFYTLLCRI